MITLKKPVKLPETLFEKTKWWFHGIKIYKTEWDEHPILLYTKGEPIEFGGGGIGYNRITHPAGSISIPQRHYYCMCGTELTDGPTGGAAVNAVCEKCRLNYGCLPGYGL